jgi:hypothetical protein
VRHGLLGVGLIGAMVLAAPGEAPAATGQAVLTWTDNSSGTGQEDAFDIERKVGAGGTYAALATVGPNVVTYTDAALALGQTYCYRVKARNAAGSSAFSTEACVTVAAIPPAPGGLTVTVTIVP